MKKRRGIWFVCLLLFGCHAAPSASEQAARNFVDAYYVQINLPQALSFSDGLAANKIQTSVDLTKGVPPQEGDLRPKVSFKMIKKENDDLGERYLFELSIKPKNFSEITRQTVVRVRQTEAGWKVTQFSDT